MIKYFLKTEDAKTVTLDFPQTGARKSSEINVSFPGVSSEDFVSLDGNFPKDANFQAWVSGTDKITVRYNNYTNSSVNLTSFQVRLLVLKKEIVTINTTQQPSLNIETKDIRGNKILDSEDINKMLNILESSIITIPNDSSFNFSVGSLIFFNSLTSEEISFSTQLGVTLNSYLDFKKLNGQFSQAYIIKISANTWQLIGNIKK